ncbi:phospholipase B [Hanseniaspora valbyensis NRRL Y-1626]|uniref:Lysophospholipase n=1 Tax=Hanseniaspora valbyensis NRRL Y-1626 TaxID=766949 RepID=A0A1B7TC14_9ASCO|nr:phospholipase B [Hanseniaspora valbyensis NRRL Y-1626]
MSNFLSIFQVALIFGTTVTAWSPSDSYTPGNVTCPSNFNLIRDAVGLSDEETNWIKKRDSITEPILVDWLNSRFGNSTQEQNLLTEIFNKNNSDYRLPRIGIAASGGGYRAMLCGAGQIAGLDNRTANGTEAGLGGILQSSTYLAGLSGGNWLVGTLAFNNWTSVQDIIDQTYNTSLDEPIWDITDSIIEPAGWDYIKDYDIWDNISDDVEGKKQAGFNVSLTDAWGLALTRDFFPSLTDSKGHGMWGAMSFSDLAKYDAFVNAEMPFTIHVADSRYPGTSVVNTNNTLFEFNAFEMGSWDGTVNSFANITYVGTSVENGTPVSDNCTVGFDSVPFILGTSSSLFNEFLLEINSTSISSFLKDLVTDYLTDLSTSYDDIAIWSPNPFYKTDDYFSNVTSQMTSSASIVNNTVLYLGDGGEDGENIPFVPLLQQEREVDVIFALDNSCDTDACWPAGLSLVATYERQFGLQRNDLAFPYVPDAKTFVNLGLNKRPTFFGCDASNMTDLAYIPPLIVYIPNSEYSMESNTSTFKMSYSSKKRLEMIQNGFEVVSYNNLTGYDSYDYCISCAIIRRSQERLGLNTTSECEQCFTDFCWDGSHNDTALPSWDAIDESSSSSSISFQTDAVTATSSSSSASYNAGVSTTSSLTSSASKTKNNANNVRITSSLTSIALFLLSLFV